MNAKEELKSVLEATTTAMQNALQTTVAALKSKDIEQYGIALNDLKTRVDEHNKIVRKADFAEFLEAENPMIEAITKFFHQITKVKENHSKEDGTVIGVSLELSQARIDIQALCEFSDGELSVNWVKKADHLLDLFVLRETNVFAMKPSEIAEKGNFFIGVAKAKKNGETPDSNTQMGKLLQEIVDDMIFVDNGEGKNVYKVTVHDLIFCKDALTKLNIKDKCSIQTMKPRAFRMVIASVLAHILGEQYRVASGKKEKK